MGKRRWYERERNGRYLPVGERLGGYLVACVAFQEPLAKLRRMILRQRWLRRHRELALGADVRLDDGDQSAPLRVGDIVHPLEGHDLDVVAAPKVLWHEERVISTQSG